jgi:hypothetical protein
VVTYLHKSIILYYNILCERNNCKNKLFYSTNCYKYNKIIIIYFYDYNRRIVTMLVQRSTNLFFVTIIRFTYKNKIQYCCADK